MSWLTDFATATASDLLNWGLARLDKALNKPSTRNPVAAPVYAKPVDPALERDYPAGSIVTPATQAALDAAIKRATGAK